MRHAQKNLNPTETEAWFARNPNRSFKIDVLSAATARAIYPSAPANAFTGKTLRICFWRFVSDTTKVFEQVLVPNAPEELLRLAEATAGTDDLGYRTFIAQEFGPVPIRPEDVVVRGTASDLVIL